jgi:hypothetical protein
MIVKVRAAFPGTVSRGWTTRRYKKCTRSLLHALSLAFPADGSITVTLDVTNTFGIDNFTYTVEFPEDARRQQVEFFVRLAKQVKHFYAVDLILAPEPATIPA